MCSCACLKKTDFYVAGVRVYTFFSFFVLRFKNEKRINLSFLHLVCFGHPTTSSSRQKLVVSVGHFGRPVSVLKTNSQKMHRRSGVSKCL